MIRFPVLKAHLRAEVIAGEGVILLSENSIRTLHGKAYEQVIPLLDGRRSADDIVDALTGVVDAAIVYYAISQLAAKGHVTEATPEIAPAVAAFWQAAGVDVAVAVAALREKSVALQTIGMADAATARAALDAMGIAIAPVQSADLLLVLTDDYLRPELAAINAAALAVGQAWLLVRTTGPEVWLGPLFEPGAAACWDCLRLRLERHRIGHGFVARRNALTSFPTTAQAMLHSAQAAACNMAVTTAARFLTGAPNNLADRMLSLDWNTLTPSTHSLVRHPHCPACGAADSTQGQAQPQPQPQPLQLQAGKANFVRDGGHRSVPPEKTLRKYEHLISPISGVVKCLAPVAQVEGVAHVYMAGHNSAHRLERLSDLKQGLRNASSGKGISETQAKASALCEAIERYSGEFTGSELRVARAFRDWPQGEAIHPRDVTFYSEQQYVDRDAWNARESRFNVVPAPLPDTTVIDWTPLWSLTAQRHKYLPTQLLYYSMPAAAGDNTMYSVGCSNGCASGNTLEEAILQGFFELVERDAVALWWYNRLSRPGVDIASFGEPYLLELQEHYRHRCQRETWALDLTSDLGIPVFVAFSKCTSGPHEQLLFGLGCHLDAKIALQRAFAEMNQMLGAAQPGDNGELVIDDKEVLEWLLHATVANQPYVAPDRDLPCKRLDDYPLQHSGEFLQDIQHCRSIVEAQGMEMLVLDQTRADVKMPVVKVVVPGLRHFWARFAPGRLYDVPVKMGWLQQALPEAELNPILMFM